MVGRLAGRVALVTGASRGVGRVMAGRFAAEGAKVALIARNAEGVADAARAIGGAAIGLVADVTREDEVNAAFAQVIETLGGIDILVNNAAAPGEDRFVWEQTLVNWNATFAIDLTAAMLCTREALSRSMLARRRGSIINISSTAGYASLPRKSPRKSLWPTICRSSRLISLTTVPPSPRT